MAAAGLEPGDSLVVPVAGRKHSVSLIWRSHDAGQAADFGRIRELLEEMAVNVGDKIVVVPGADEVKVYQEEEAPVASEPESESQTGVDQQDALVSVLDGLM